MRESDPVSYDEATRSWHLVRYEDVWQVLRDSSRFTSMETAGAASHSFSHLIALDPPQHQRVRKLLIQALPPRFVSQFAPRITELVHALLDRVRPRGTMDVIGDLAAPLSASVLAELLGIPAEHRLAFRQWIDALVGERVQESAGSIAGTSMHVSASGALQEFPVSLLELLEERRRQPRQDVISRLLAVSVDGDSTSEMEVMAGLHGLVAGGYATMMYLLGNAIFCLDAHPEVSERLRHEPAPIYSSIDEVLRYLPPVWMVTRMTRTEVRLGEWSIPPQAQVCAWIVSANRDTEHFAHPEHFDIDRIPNRHLSFGEGIHACLGAGLARLVTTITVSMLFKELPDLKRVSDLPLAVIEHPTHFGVKHFPIRFTSPSPSV